jgi:hypothetical protein
MPIHAWRANQRWSEFARCKLGDLAAAPGMSSTTPCRQGWTLGSPSYHDERREWLLYAFDTTERPVVGLRSREWTAIAESEVGVVREMARCLWEIGAGRPPK